MNCVNKQLSTEADGKNSITKAAFDRCHINVGWV